MKIKKWLLLTFSSFAFAAPFQNEEWKVPTAPKIKESHYYQKLSLMYTQPSYGVGYRYRSGHIGYDVSLNISPLVVVNGFAAKTNFLTYLKKSESTPYLGFGVGVYGLYNSFVKEYKAPLSMFYDDPRHFTVRGTTNLILGYQQKNGFWEVDLGVTPRFATNEKIIEPHKSNLNGKIAGWNITFTKGWNF